MLPGNYWPVEISYACLNVQKFGKRVKPQFKQIHLLYRFVTELLCQKEWKCIPYTCHLCHRSVTAQWYKEWQCIPYTCHLCHRSVTAQWYKEWQCIPYTCHLCHRSVTAQWYKEWQCIPYTCHLCHRYVTTHSLQEKYNFIHILVVVFTSKVHTFRHD
jgi:hypothetical protein